MARLLHLKNIIIFKLVCCLERAKTEYRCGRFFSANWCHRKFFRRKEPYLYLDLCSLNSNILALKIR